MIIKSMARKTASFTQLAEYMDKGRQSFQSYETYYNNLYSRNSEGISLEFKNNASNLQERKNGNYLYHEVISITKNPNLSLEQQKQILYQMVNDYVSLRAKRNLVYGIMHTDKPNDLHFHLMISSNELGSDKRHRLNKATFANIQKSIEKNVLNNFPELNQKIIYNQNKDEKTKKEEYELKNRTGKQSQRDKIKIELENIFVIAKSKADFFTLLSEKGFDLYIHGNTIGVTSKETGKNYRLKTLGLLDSFNKISGKIQEVEDRKEEVKEARTENKFKTDKVNTSYYHEQQKQAKEKLNEENLKRQAQEEKAKEERKTKEEPQTHYEDKADIKSNEGSEKKQNKRYTKDYSTQNKKSEEDKQHKREEKRYSKPKEEKSHKPKAESDLKQSKQEDKQKQQREQNNQTKAHYTEKPYRKKDNKKDYKARFKEEKVKPNEPLNEVELEIEKRKKQMKKERENEANYSNDYSKGK